MDNIIFVNILSRAIAIAILSQAFLVSYVTGRRQITKAKVDRWLSYVIFRKKYVKLLVTRESKTEFIADIGTVIVPLAPW